RHSAPCSWVMAPTRPTAGCKKASTTCGPTSTNSSTTTICCAIYPRAASPSSHRHCANPLTRESNPPLNKPHSPCLMYQVHGAVTVRARSEEHTSELQSRFDLVCRLLLEKNTKTRGA